MLNWINGCGKLWAISSCTKAGSTRDGACFLLMNVALPNFYMVVAHSVLIPCIRATKSYLLLPSPQRCLPTPI